MPKVANIRTGVKINYILNGKKKHLIINLEEFSNINFYLSKKRNERNELRFLQGRMYHSLTASNEKIHDLKFLLKTMFNIRADENSAAHLVRYDLKLGNFAKSRADNKAAECLSVQNRNQD